VDIKRTHAVFVDCVELFTTTDNRKGLGASLSNLGALELAMGRSDTAKKHFEKAIELAKERVASLETTSKANGEEGAAELSRAKRILSDRQGSLAVCMLEQGDLLGASRLFEQLLEFDQKSLYIRGCIVKQSILGHAYLRTNQWEAAERVFRASLTLVRELQQNAMVRGSAMSEADACEMLALCDLASWEEARNWRTTPESAQVLEHRYLEALMAPVHMELSTAKRILRSLTSLYSRLPQYVDAKKLVTSIVEAQGIKLKAEGWTVVKRVVFVMDYSSSMSGSRIRSLKDGLHAVVRDQVFDRDSVALLSFNNTVVEVLPLTVKGSNAMHIAKRVEALVSPVGGTALYDGLLQAVGLLKKEATSGDWIVVVADGADDRSKAGLEEVLREISSSKVAVVVVGVGKDAPEEVLKRVAAASVRGKCVTGDATKQDMADLFDEVARTIQSTPVSMEDY